MATHDKDLSTCADRILTVEDRILRESAAESSGDPSQLPEPVQSRDQRAISSLIRWSIRMELRNPIETVVWETPAIVAILLS